MNSKSYFVHPQALVETDSIGEDTRVWAFAHVMKGAVIGSHCNICDHSFVESNVHIGDNVTIKNGVSVWDGVTLENNVFVGPNAVFTNDLNPRAQVKKTREQFAETKLHKKPFLADQVADSETDSVSDQRGADQSAEAPSHLQSAYPHVTALENEILGQSSPDQTKETIC